MNSRAPSVRVTSSKFFLRFLELGPRGLSREIPAHVRLVLVMEVPEERSSAQRRALHPWKARGIAERVLRQFLYRRHEQLQDTTRFGENLAHGLIAIARVEPGIDLV